MKIILIRFKNGFVHAIAITLLIQAVLMSLLGTTPLLPEFAAHYANELQAYMAELLLIGLMSGITSAGTVVMEAKRIGMVYQSILFILIMLAAWIPIACYVWGFHKYVPSMISTIVSIVVTYGIVWWLRYTHCKKEIDEINAKLNKRTEPAAGRE